MLKLLFLRTQLWIHPRSLREYQQGLDELRVSGGRHYKPVISWHQSFQKFSSPSLKRRKGRNLRPACLGASLKWTPSTRTTGGYWSLWVKRDIYSSLWGYSARKTFSCQMGAIVPGKRLEFWPRAVIKQTANKQVLLLWSSQQLELCFGYSVSWLEHHQMDWRLYSWKATLTKTCTWRKKNALLISAF